MRNKKKVLTKYSRGVQEACENRPGVEKPIIMQTRMDEGVGLACDLKIIILRLYILIFASDSTLVISQTRVNDNDMTGEKIKNDRKVWKGAPNYIGL